MNADAYQAMSKQQLVDYRSDLRAMLSLDNTKEECERLVSEIYSLSLLIDSED